MDFADKKMALIRYLCYNKQNTRFLWRFPWQFTSVARCIWKPSIFSLRTAHSFGLSMWGEQLGFTKPSVSRAMSILKKDGYVNVDADGANHPDGDGLAIAKTMYTRHTVLSQMLMELGVDEKTATEDACRIEHVISEKSFAAVQAHLEQVTKMREDAHGQ